MCARVCACCTCVLAWENAFLSMRGWLLVPREKALFSASAPRSFVKGIAEMFDYGVRSYLCVEDRLIFGLVRLPFAARRFSGQITKSQG